MTGQERYDAIQAHLASSPKAFVAVCTATRTTVFKPKHAAMFRVGKKGDLQMQRGKAWESLTFTAVQLGIK